MTIEKLNLASGTPYVIARPPSTTTSDYGLVIGPDMVGLRPAFEDIAERLASDEGWVVTAPEPFPGQEDWDVWTKYDAMANVDATRQLADVLAAADATGAKRVGMIGFCLGGFHAYRAAPTGRFEAVVAMYGPITLPEIWRTGKGQEEPLEALRRPRTCPVLALIAGLDSVTPPDDVAKLRTVKGVEVVVYEQADHAFVHDTSRATHRPDDAADAMARALRFLKSPPVL